MKYLVDTNIISNMTKPRPNRGVMRWFADTSDADMFISVISIGEVTYGIARLSDSAKKTKLKAWLSEVVYVGFDGRIMNIDVNIMTVWGEMLARLPHTLPIQDTLIAATALAHNMAVVTHNIKDFKGIAGLKLLNPWED